MWRAIRRWFSRIRSISTPLVGVTWDPPPKDGDPSTLPAPEAHLSEEEDEILAVLGNAGDQSLELDEIGQAEDLTDVRARYHLDILEEQGLVSHSEDPEYGYVYFLTPRGRRYVVEQDLAD